MQIIKTVLWVLIAVIVVIFAMNNREQVTLTIWDGMVWETRLYFVIVGAFLAGLVPTWLLYRGTRWRANRRISTLETTIEAQRPKPAPMVGTADQLEEAQKPDSQKSEGIPLL